MLTLILMKSVKCFALFFILKGAICNLSQSHGLILYLTFFFKKKKKKFTLVIFFYFSFEKNHIEPLSFYHI
jgi:hypothetical protein